MEKLLRIFGVKEKNSLFLNRAVRVGKRHMHEQGIAWNFRKSLVKKLGKY